MRIRPSRPSSVLTKMIKPLLFMLNDRVVHREPSLTPFVLLFPFPLNKTCTALVLLIVTNARSISRHINLGGFLNSCGRSIRIILPSWNPLVRKFTQLRRAGKILKLVRWDKMLLAHGVATTLGGRGRRRGSGFAKVVSYEVAFQERSDCRETGGYYAADRF